MINIRSTAIGNSKFNKISFPQSFRLFPPPFLCRHVSLSLSLSRARVSQGKGTDKKVFKRKVLKEDFKELTEVE